MLKIKLENQIKITGDFLQLLKKISPIFEYAKLGKQGPKVMTFAYAITGNISRTT